MTNPKITSKTVISNQNTNIFKDLYHICDQQSGKNMTFFAKNMTFSKLVGDHLGIIWGTFRGLLGVLF